MPIDVDECEGSSMNNCDQLCNNTEGSYHCSCNGGFQLADDGATCEGIETCTYSVVFILLCV